MTMLMSSTRKWIGVAAVLGMLLTTAFAAVPPERQAQAGTNGQQIQFNCHALTYVVIEGYNQKGVWTRWSGSVPNRWSVTTWGWWWKGNVLIQYQQTNDNRNYYWSSQWSWVPTVWYQDGIRIDCTRPAIR
jgi:hypothetical protein